VPVNPDLLGYEFEPVTSTWTSTDALLYALGIGGGTSELAFTTENFGGAGQLVFPTFGVVIGWIYGRQIPGITYREPSGSFHGEQRITLHRPIPPSGAVTGRSKIVGLYDKGKAAVVVTETKVVDINDGAPLCTTYMSSYLRGEGGWGGDRGPSGARNVPPERAPDYEITYRTSLEQALLYRLSGDRNPLHVDPSLAAAAGFDRPILHGLCTYGFTGRALLHALCASDPARFRQMEARFSSPVLPGDDLTVRIWVVGEGTAVFNTAKQDGTIVIAGGGLHYT
jgi:acyl dehydratase